ncbi:MAG: phosphatidylserine decarboxylase family protein [Bacteroidota bacterium]
MKIACYGRNLITWTIAGAAGLSTGVQILDLPNLLKLLIPVICIVWVGFTIFFFRDPERCPVLTPSESHVIIAPADGKILSVAEVYEPEYFGKSVWQVSIFMSPLNVHVNRVPISGTVEYLRYVPGKYLVAFDEKSSERNERMLIGIKNETLQVLMRQIAGFIARRIVCTLNVGQNVKAGERCGMIKFGSRVDVLFPESYTPVIHVGDSVKAGETIIAIPEKHLSHFS